MTEITQAEFRKYRPDNSNRLAVEKRWFKHGKLLGIVCEDQIDRDWSWVMLAKRDMHWVAVEVRVSMPTSDAAAEELETILQYSPMPDMTKPTKSEEMVIKFMEQAYKNTGITEEQFEALFLDFTKKKPSAWK